MQGVPVQSVQVVQVKPVSKKLDFKTKKADIVAPPRHVAPVAPPRPRLVFLPRSVAPVAPVASVAQVRQERQSREQQFVQPTFDKEKFVRDFRAQGISLLDLLGIQELKRIVHIANDAYYNQNAFLSDDEFDVIKEYVEKKNPSVNFGVGAKATRNKVTLPYFMGSMDKIKPDTDAVSKWKIKYTGPYVISTKLDGVSGLFVVKNGTKKLYTRGDGVVGQDISHLIPYLRLPNAIEGVAIRGEFIIRKDAYAKLRNDTPSRNYVSGAMNRLTVVPNDYKIIDFVAYELVSPSFKPSKQFEFLVENCPVVAKHSLVENIDNTLLSNLLVEWRNSYEYEIDGVIVVDDKVYERKKGNPDHAFAFKMVLDDQIVEAKVLDVEWSASKHGLLKPRVRIEDVYIGGARISYATGFNAKFILDNKVGVGAVVKLIRSGDVIPHIMSVTKPAASAIMPSGNYTWTSTGVDIILVDVQEDETVQQKRLIDFFKKLKIKGAGPAVVAKIHGAGFGDVASVVNMSLSDYLDIFGRSSKTGSKLYESVQEAVGSASLPELVNASNVLDKGFGLTRLEAIFEAYPRLLSSSPENIKNKLMSIDGVSSKLADAFVSKVQNINSFLQAVGKKSSSGQTPQRAENVQRAQKVQRIQKVQQPLTTKELDGVIVLFTGVRNIEVEKLLKSKGAKIASAFNSSVTHLVAKDTAIDTGKAKKAREKGIPILSMEEIKKFL